MAHNLWCMSYNLPPRPVLNLVVNRGRRLHAGLARGPAAATWFLMTSSSLVG